MKTIPSSLSILHALWCLLLAASSTQATTYYIATTGNDGNPGTAAQPFKTIQQGILAAANGDTIQVAAGTYSERIIWTSKSLALQGAGAGQSIIDGAGAGTCLMVESVPSTALIQGFTIQNGKSPFGGGIYAINSSPTVNNCTFTDNIASNTVAHSQGGGMYIGVGSPTLNNCFFRRNSAISPVSTFDGDGGGLFIGSIPSGPSATLNNCVFADNSASNFGGGLCNISAGSPAVNNCTFTGNSTLQGIRTTSGGGMYSIGSTPIVNSCLFTGNISDNGGGMAFYYNANVVNNCTFTGNTARGFGAGIYNFFCSPTVNNSILWGDGGGVEIVNDAGKSATVNFSDVAGGYAGPGTSNINVDPLFLNPGLANYRLQPGSPCINVGSATVFNLPAIDLNGAPRIIGSAPDMGAYEARAGFWAVIWFVDGTLGGDNNPGTRVAPFATVTKALQVAASGQGICIKPGNYGSDRPRITKSIGLLNWIESGPVRIGAF